MLNRSLAALILIFLLTTTATVVDAKAGFVQLSSIPNQQLTNSLPKLFTPLKRQFKTTANLPNQVK
ncbi:MAG TPA: hypothetical protein DCY91_09270 [Cyanobacteria bacterium UBA11370]|nr:hypothetical protein [Cyanobacteria bacterium UBA11370]HBY79812.1 hypothetical protein [Cyanobacteria bacterium UBA11148]